MCSVCSSRHSRSSRGRSAGGSVAKGSDRTLDAGAERQRAEDQGVGGAGSLGCVARLAAAEDRAERAHDLKGQSPSHHSSLGTAIRHPQVQLAAYLLYLPYFRSRAGPGSRVWVLPAHTSTGSHKPSCSSALTDTRARAHARTAHACGASGASQGGQDQPSRSPHTQRSYRRRHGGVLEATMNEAQIRVYWCCWSAVSGGMVRQELSVLALRC